MQKNPTKLNFICTKRFGINERVILKRIIIRFNITHSQRVIFQPIQFKISHLFAHSLNVKQFCLTYR